VRPLRFVARITTPPGRTMCSERAWRASTRAFGVSRYCKTFADPPETALGSQLNPVSPTRFLVDAGGVWGPLGARGLALGSGIRRCGRRAAIGSPRGNFGCDRPRDRPRRRAWAVIGHGSTRRRAVKNRRSALPILSLEAPRGVAVRPAGRDPGPSWLALASRMYGCYEIADLAGVRVISSWSSGFVLWKEHHEVSSPHDPEELVATAEAMLADSRAASDVEFRVAALEARAHRDRERAFARVTAAYEGTATYTQMRLV